MSLNENIDQELKEEAEYLTPEVIKEDKGWHVHIGHEQLQPIISRFKELSDLLAAKSVLNEFSESYSKKDPLTGLANRKGITEAIEIESDRFIRYKNSFSLMMLHVDIKKSVLQTIDDEALDFAMKSLADTIGPKLRKSDLIGRWDRGSFLIILPETPQKGAQAAAEKLLKKLYNHTFICNGKVYTSLITISTSEYRSSLKDTLSSL